MPIRPATVADADAIAALHAASWRSAYRGILKDDTLGPALDGERRTHWRRKLAAMAPADAVLIVDGQGSRARRRTRSRESGAQSLSLNVAQQTTNSQRTTIGADLGSSIGLGNERKLDLAVRLGWQHEFADTGRPITAAFAGAPGNSFTVFGATPTRDAAVVGFQAMTNIAEATQVYLRYDGGVGGGTDNHAINLGLRMSW